ncbi:MAG: thioredoxin [Gemmatimonadota bacterium]|nr:MAG: thioredoxin [Gemmatimonadota bacterium]
MYDDNFEAEVLKSDLPVVVDFWATWCRPCQVMSGLMSELAKEYAGRVNVYKMNVDQCRGTAQAFGIRSIPTVILFKSGAAVDRVVGLMPKDELAKKFDALCGLREGVKTSSSKTETNI